MQNIRRLVYLVSTPQLIRYSRACDFYHVFLDRGLLLTRTKLNIWFVVLKLKSSLRKFYGRHHDLVYRYRKLTDDQGYISFVVIKSRPFPIMTYHRVCQRCSMTDTTSRAGLLSIPERLSLSSVFSWDSCCSIFSILCSGL